MSFAEAIAVEIESLPPAGLDVPQVAAWALENDVSVTQRTDGDWPPAQRDIADQVQSALGFHSVDEKSVIPRAGGGEPAAAASKSDALNPVLTRRRSIGVS